MATKMAKNIWTAAKDTQNSCKDTQNSLKEAENNHKDVKWAQRGRNYEYELLITTSYN